jgi:hypothetical protein
MKKKNEKRKKKKEEKDFMLELETHVSSPHHRRCRKDGVVAMWLFVV